MSGRYNDPIIMKGWAMMTFLTKVAYVIDGSSIMIEGSSKAKDF